MSKTLSMISAFPESSHPRSSDGRCNMKSQPKPKPKPKRLEVFDTEDTATLPDEGEASVVKVLLVSYTYSVWCPKAKDWLRSTTGARRSWTSKRKCREASWKHQYRVDKEEDETDG